MKETFDAPLIPSVFEPLEKLRISSGYGGQRNRMKRKIKEERKHPQVENGQVEEIKEEPERRNIVNITI